MSILISVIIFALGMCGYLSVIKSKQDDIKMLREMRAECGKSFNEIHNNINDINNNIDEMRYTLKDISNTLKQDNAVLSAILELRGNDDDE